MKRAAILLSCCIAAAAFGQSHQAAAEAALPILSVLAKQSPTTAGITKAKVAKATVDAGVRLMHIGLRDLRAYAGGDPHKLLTDARTTLHGVYSKKGELMSEITIADTPNGPQPVEFARTALLRQYFAIRGAEKGGEFLLNIPALNSWFVARDVKNTLMLTPMHDIPGFAKGKQVDAMKVLQALKERAQRIGDDDLT